MNDRIIIKLCFVIGVVFLCGMVSLVKSVTSDNYLFKKAKVVEVREKTLKVEIGSQHGDPTIYEIKKPSFIKINKGDYIDVKSKNGIIKYTMFNEELTSYGRMALIFVPILCCAALTLYELRRIAIKNLMGE